jgi:hypothetical protein
MNLAWLKFPVDDLDSYERRHRRNYRVGAAIAVVIAPMWMFEDAGVHVSLGIVALVIGGIVGLVAGLVANRRQPDLSERSALPLWRRVLVPDAIAVAVVFAVHLFLDDMARTVLVSGLWMVLGVSFFLRAPALARYRRLRYEADLAEVAGHPRPSGV